MHELGKDRGADGKTVLEKIPMPNPAGDPKANEKINFFLSPCLRTHETPQECCIISRIIPTSAKAGNGAAKKT